MADPKNPTEDDLRRANFQELARRSQSLTNTLTGMTRGVAGAGIGLLAFNAVLKAQTQSMNANFRLLGMERREKLTQLNDLKNKIGPLTRAEIQLKRNLMEEIEGLTQDMRLNRAQTKTLKLNAIADAIDQLNAPIKMFADGLRNFVNSVYQTQQQIGVGRGAGLYAETQARMASIISKIPGVQGPILETQELVDAYAAFTSEFGTILTGPEARELGETAKSIGVASSTLVKAQRAFLAAGGNLANLQSVYAKQFISAGLTEAQALKFAAENANLVAIAGVKYADSLARAAANATKIGVSLDKTSGFFDNMVDDFEGALERSVELSALGFNIDFNELARIGGMGTEEERQAALVDMFKQNRSLLEDVQRNAFLRRAIEKDTGFDISEALRMARGEEAQPRVETINELQLKELEKIYNVLEQGSKTASLVSKVGGIVSSTLRGAAEGAVGGLALGKSPQAAGVGAVIGAIGGLISGFSTEVGAGRAAGGLITGPGTATSDNILTPTSPGEYVINAKATKAYGVDFLDTINRGQLNQNMQQPQANTVVNVNLNELKEEFKQLKEQMRGMSVNMDGSRVGEIVFNSGTPLSRVSVY